MADPFLEPLPLMGDAPWTLNPAVTELRGRVSTTEDSTTNQALADRALNVESPFNEAIVSVSSGVFGGDVSGVPTFYDGALDNNNAPRPLWNGVVVWRVWEGAPRPTFFREGDSIEEVEVEPVPWNPLEHPYTVSWFDPYSLSGADGSAVSSWVDRAPSGITLTQATSGLQPTISNTAINGNRGVVFGSGKFLLSGTFTTRNRRPMTTYMVVGGGPATQSGSSAFAMDRLLDATSLGGAIGRTSANKWTFANGSTTNATSTVDSNASAHIIKVWENDSETRLYVDNILVATSTTSTGRLTFNKLAMGARGDGANSWPGYSGDMVQVASALGHAGESDLLFNNFLKARAGL